MTLKDQLDALLDATAFDSTGAKIGAVRQVYVDDASGKITFATVSTGIFSSDAIIPLHGARLLDDELHVDHTRSVIRDSPRPDHTEDALTPDQEIKLLEYYGIEAPGRDRQATPSTASSTPAAPPRKTPASKAPASASSKKAPPETVPATSSSQQDAPAASPREASPTEKAPRDVTPAKTPPKTSAREATPAARRSQVGEAPAEKKTTENPGTTTTRSPDPEGSDARKSDQPRPATPGTPESGSGKPRPGGATERPAGGDRAN